MGKKKLMRSTLNQKLFGVCGGFGNYFDIDPTIIRVIWIILVFVYGFGFMAYLICALIMPIDPLN